MRLRSLLYSLPVVASALLPMSSTVAAFAADATGPYSIVDHWKIGGEGGWDYLVTDSAKHTLYLTHGTRVEVVDTDTGKVVGAIQELKGTHGVALDADGKKGYISEGAGNAVVVFDRQTYEKVNSIPVGTNPDAILFEPVTKTIWAFNGKSNDASVIDGDTQKVVATIKLSGRPEFSVSDGKGTIFVNIETKNSIVRLDAKSKAVTAEWPLPGCESPSGLAMDVAGQQLFSVCDGKVMTVTDASSGKQLAKVAIGDGSDAAAFEEKNQLAFSSNGDGTLSVVDAKAHKVIQTLATQKGARTMALDAGRDRVYLVTAEFGPKPAATAANPRPRATPVPGSFTVIAVGRK
ncbi:MAG TPA: YncE family protein [Acidisarcina sp.]|nr:YncE family protein [Acidisarcina sp.]